MTRIVCILGMHRSGTSSLAGSLQEAGLYLGDVNTAATHNIKGNRENYRIWQLHDAILQHSGGTWWQPPDHVQWSDTHRAERDAIIRSFGDRQRWGFKDPRTLLLLDFWQETISDLVFVGTFRHPLHVAESLCRREGGRMEEWLDIWTRYNACLLSLHDAEAFPVVRFDLGEQEYCRSLAIIANYLGLQMQPSMGFFDPTLRHFGAAQMPMLPAKVDQLYRSLCRIALEPGHADMSGA